MDLLRIVSVSFHTAGKLFDFDARDLELQAGDKVIVETERGRALGEVVGEVREVSPKEAPPKLKAVQRQATENDLAMASGNQQREAEALQFCKRRVAERRMEMKLVRAEYLYDGSKIIFYFTADGRVDFRELVRDLAQHFRTRIEMRQIGVRDEAKLVGGIGICGRELCCCSYLRNFAPVSVKMAKAQGLALNPSKISGQCGRLLCCLAYEYDTYSDLRKNLPKCGKKIQLDSGPAEVVAIDVLAQKMTVCCANGDRCSITADEFKKGVDKCATAPAASAQAGAGHPAKKSGQGDAEEAVKKGKQRSRRSSGRNRSQRSGRPSEVGGATSQEQQKPQGKSAAKVPAEKAQPESKPEKGEKQEPAKRRRNRRRPRRRQNRPQPPETSS